MANIVSDYGAVGDGGWALTPVTITSGTKNLAAATAIWAAGDAGKSIAIAYDQFAAPFISVITTVTDSTHVVLRDNWTPATKTAANLYVTWGTDNAAQFDAFTAANQGATVTLTVPAGKYFIGYANGPALFDGITNITFNFTGGSYLLGGTISMGAATQYQDNAHSARTATAFLGSTTVTLLTPSQVSLFTVGKWALLTGTDTQGIWLGPGGFPSNPNFWYYVLVSAIDSSPVSPTYGKVSFATTPLPYTFRSNWPSWNSGNTVEVDNAGPATLYALHSEFDYTFVINDMTLVHAHPTGFSGKSITLNNCVIKSGANGLFTDNGVFPTLTKSFTLNNCDLSTCSPEFDKISDTVVMRSTNVNDIKVQSASPNNLIIDACPIGLMHGTPKAATITNSTFGRLIPGPYHYGAASSLNCDSCVITAFGSGNDHDAGYSVGDIRAYMSISNGVITVPNTQNALTWAIPGTFCFWQQTNHIGIFGFTIYDVTQDGTNVYVHTNWVGGFPPNLSGGDGTLYIYPHPCPSFTMTNCTGNDYVVALSRSPAGLPLYSHLKRTYSNAQSANAGVDMEFFPILGRIVELKITVDTAYTGAGGATIQPKTRFSTLVAADYSLVATKNPVVNLKVAGTRTLNTSGGYPAAWTGLQSGDTLPTYTEALWSDAHWQNVMTDLSADPSHPCSVTVEVTTNQGIIDVPTAVVPLRFRLHS